MKSFLRLSAGLLLGVIVLLALVLLWYRGASKAQVDGQLQVPGLRQAVDVVRDSEGIPHIYAANTRDAWFSLGYVHAQDRLWQMEMNRRIAAGRVAEILGPKALPGDRFLRTLGVRRNAERIFQKLAPDTRAILTAYADGINAYLAHHAGPLPLEFQLTGAPRPAPWTPADSISWQTMIAWDLGANWTQEILRMRLAERLTSEQVNAFLPPYPGDPALPTRDYGALYRSLHASLESLQQLAKLAPPSGIEGMGSNNWVVDGRHSTTGKPLLANDPHLGLTAPSVWYYAHVSAPGLDAAGATLPSLPGIVLGRNQRVAWGMTNTGPDVQDLYLERVRPGAPGQYQAPQGWLRFDTREEIIKVKGQPDVVMPVRESRHGPVITGALPVLDKSGLDSQYVVSFAWTALRDDDFTVQAGLRLATAGNPQEIQAALRDFHSPQMNVVYADVDGNIGFTAAGRVPVRKAGNDLHGLAPAPGWDARYDWDGFIPFEALPRQFNPASGSIATANQKIVGPDYPYFLTYEWALPYRAQRIEQLLAARDKHDLNSFATIQKDTLSLAAAQLLPAVMKTQPLDEASRRALALLSGWKGEMTADAPQPLIFNAWMRELARQMFEDELGESLFKDYAEQRNVHLPMVQALLRENGQQNWCRDTRANGAAASDSAAAADCGVLLSRSLQAALAGLQKEWSGDMQSWRWGQAHMALFEHRPFSQVAWLSRLFELRVPSPGDTYTVDVGRYNPRDEAHPFFNRHAAGFRALYDMSNAEATRVMPSTGQSGNPFSPLYRSFLQRWADASTVPLHMARQQAEQGALGTLHLAP